jgi:hypothetical protein
MHLRRVCVRTQIISVCVRWRLVQRRGGQGWVGWARMGKATRKSEVGEGRRASMHKHADHICICACARTLVQQWGEGGRITVHLHLPSNFPMDIGKGKTTAG